jgi:2-polyprenyl-3-methyl-5-hydroxy-6-metoxy-1,4-benzoquinol methylase
MDYNAVYSMAFSQSEYSNDHHIQYDYVIEKLKQIYNTNDIFELIDIGSGRGQLIALLQQNFKNINITSVDLKKNHNISVSFITCNLSKHDDRMNLLNKTYDVLVCTDVLEHLDKSFINEVITLFSKLSSKSILAIANHSDVLNGIELHTIQENNVWWENILLKVYNIKEYDTKYNNRLLLYTLDSNIA